MSTLHPYGKYFFMKNKDPYNYVLNKDFFFYAILATYIFFFWVITAIYENYNWLMEVSSTGQVIAIINNIVLGFVVFLIFVSLINPNSPQIYPLGGIIFILFLVNISLLIFTFDIREISPYFEKDPIALSFAFLITYSFVNYYLC